MKLASGSTLGSSADEAHGGTFTPGNSPDPRWPLLNRWSQASPSATPPPKATVHSPIVESLTVKSPKNSISPTASPSHSQAKSPRSFLSPVLGSSSLKITDFFPTTSLVVPSREVFDDQSTQKGVKASVAILPRTPAVPSPSVNTPPASNSSAPGSPALRGAWAGEMKAHPETMSSERVLKKTETQLTKGNPINSTGLVASVSPPLRGAWGKKLLISNSSADQHVGHGVSSPQHSLPVDSSKEKEEENLRFPWAAKMDPGSRNLYRATSPEFMEDGTPLVRIPSHVMLQGLENQKEYVLGQFYRCSPPPGGLVHAVVNKIWGRKCRIFVRKLEDSMFLFHIPDASTRAWVLQRGLWHIDDCLLFVAPWSTAETFDIPEISTVPVWVTLKNIPHRLYSIPGISHIASGLGAPMATYKPRLDPSLMGQAKILVEVELSKAFPPRIAAADKKGNISMVNVDYSWVPTTCGDCGQLGHKASRCSKASVPRECVTKTGSIEIITPAIVASEVLSDTNLDLGAAPIIVTDLSTSVGDHTEAVDEVATEVIPIVFTEDIPTVTVVADVVTVTIPNTGITEDIADEKEKVCLSEREESIVLAGNRFSRIGSSFSDGNISHSDGDSSVSEDSEDEFDLLVPMTPSGQRLLRERPVQPSIKAMEVQASSTARGRGNRGRGSRGRRGRGNAGRG